MRRYLPEMLALLFTACNSAAPVVDPTRTLSPADVAAAAFKTRVAETNIQEVVRATSVLPTPRFASETNCLTEKEPFLAMIRRGGRTEIVTMIMYMLGIQVNYNKEQFYVSKEMAERCRMCSLAQLLPPDQGWAKDFVVALEDNGRRVCLTSKDWIAR